MTYTTEESVRREVGKILRVDYSGQFICSSCLAKLVLHTFGTSHTESQIERAIAKVLESPGALVSVPTFICAGCEKAMPCLGAPSR
jgi:hypothetical protein